MQALGCAPLAHYVVLDQPAQSVAYASSSQLDLALLTQPNSLNQFTAYCSEKHSPKHT